MRYEQFKLNRIIFKKYCKNNHINTHTFRHTFAVRLYKKHKNMNVVSDLLGHTNISTTKIYAKTLPVDVLGEYLD